MSTNQDRPAKRSGNRGERQEDSLTDTRQETYCRDAPAAHLLKLIRSLSHPLEPISTNIPPALPRGPVPRAIIFDIYGTLFISAAGDIGKDSASHSSAALGLALADAGIHIDQDDERLSKAAEVFRDEILKCHELKRLQGVDFPEVDICEIWRKTLERLLLEEDSRPVTDSQCMTIAVSYECRTNPVWPMPGAMSLFDAFKQAGIMTGIISNAQFYTPLIFEALLGKNVQELGFDADLCAWSWRAGAAKPSLKMFRQVDHVLGNKYGIPHESILYAGNDMLKDIMPARSLNWKTALFAGDRRSLRLREDDPKVKGIKPWCIITKLEQLKSLYIN